MMPKSRRTSISNSFATALFLTLLLSHTAKAESRAGNRLTTWQRMPVHMNVPSRNDGSLVVESSIANNDSTMKYCDAYLEIEVSAGELRTRRNSWVKGILFEVDSVHKTSFQFDGVATSTLVPGSLRLGLSCVGVEPGRDTNTISPTAGCNPQRNDCDNVCLGASGDDMACQIRREGPISSAVSAEPTASGARVKVKLTSSLPTPIQCGAVLRTIARKRGTSTIVTVRKETDNLLLVAGTSEFTFELLNSAAGSGYILDPAQLRFSASCLETKEQPTAFWNIAWMTKPDLKSDLDWLKRFQ